MVVAMKNSTGPQFNKVTWNSTTWTIPTSVAASQSTTCKQAQQPATDVGMHGPVLFHVTALLN